MSCDFHEAAKRAATKNYDYAKTAFEAAGASQVAAAALAVTGIGLPVAAQLETNAAALAIFSAGAGLFGLLNDGIAAATKGGCESVKNACIEIRYMLTQTN
jgi:hypothetical protein